MSVKYSCRVVCQCQLFLEIFKMAQWSSSDSGILRKTQIVENHDELLVFGYACKLFRDDEKALYIDQGKHLIPWMGDDTLKIDRLVRVTNKSPVPLFSIYDDFYLF